MCYELKDFPGIPDRPLRCVMRVFQLLIAHWSGSRVIMSQLIMSDFFLGEIRMFGFSYAPQSWALCQGQSMPINQNQALYALIGVQYGGTAGNFLLPDLRGRAPLDQGNSTSGTIYITGTPAGTETVTLTIGQTPTHNHTLVGLAAVGDVPTPSGANIASVATDASGNHYPAYASPVPASMVALNPGTISTTATAPHSNMQPFTVMNFCIAIQGLFPSRD
jgi:microcystin-dependent protein